MQISNLRHRRKIRFCDRGPIQSNAEDQAEWSIQVTVRLTSNMNKQTEKDWKGKIVHTSYQMNQHSIHSILARVFYLDTNEERMNKGPHCWPPLSVAQIFRFGFYGENVFKWQKMLTVHSLYQESSKWSPSNKIFWSHLHCLSSSQFSNSKMQNAGNNVNHTYNTD